MYDVILIYEIIPDGTEIYYLLVDDCDFEKLAKCHSLFGNMSDMSEEQEQLVCFWLPEYLSDKISVKGMFEEQLKPIELECNGKIQIIHSGFCL